MIKGVRRERQYIAALSAGKLTMPAVYDAIDQTIRSPRYSLAKMEVDIKSADVIR